jgi:hypothetical protein
MELIVRSIMAASVETVSFPLLELESLSKLSGDSGVIASCDAQVVGWLHHRHCGPNAVTERRLT